MKTGTSKKMKDMAKFHGELVNGLLSHRGTVKPLASPWVQWALWLFLAVVLATLSLGAIRPTHWDSALQPAAIAYVLALFLGAALAAWQAIASSFPGWDAGRFRQVLLAAFLTAVLIVPFLFFIPKGEEIFEWDDFVKCGPSCFTLIFATGILPWVLLGWLLSRNASLHPKWTGAWAGISVFLLSSLVTLVHCGYWEAGHLIGVHLPAVALFSFLTAWAGARWLSRWRR